MNNLDDLKTKILELANTEIEPQATEPQTSSTIINVNSNLNLLSQKIIIDSKINPFIKEVSQIIKLSPRQEIELANIIGNFISSTLNQ